MAEIAVLGGVYAVYFLVMAGKNALAARAHKQAGPDVVYASSSLQEVQEKAKEMENQGIEVAVVKAEKLTLMERIKSGANDYTALQKRVGTNEIGTENQKHRNAYQNNLMEAAYGEPSENNIYGNLEGGRRSKRLTKRRRNGRKSSRR